MKHYLLIAIMLVSSSVSLSYGKFKIFGKKKKEEKERIIELDPNQVDAQETIKKAPGWFEKTPEKKGFEYYTAHASSSRYQTAIEKASFLARNMLLAELESQRDGYKKSYEKEIDSNDFDFYGEFEQVMGMVFSGDTNDYDLIKKEVIDQVTAEGRQVYTAYVLIEYDLGRQEEKLLQEIEQNEALYKRMEATEAFEEMERKVKEYRERKRLENK